MKDDTLTILVYSFAIFVVIPLLYGIVYFEETGNQAPEILTYTDVSEEPFNITIEKNADNQIQSISPNTISHVSVTTESGTQTYLLTPDETLNYTLTGETTVSIRTIHLQTLQLGFSTYSFYTQPIQERISTDQNPFVMTVDTRIDDGGYTDNTEFRIKTGSDSYKYNYTVYWEDKKQKGLQDDHTLDFDSPGVYQIAITGKMPHLQYEHSFVEQGVGKKIQSIDQWGDIKWQSFDKSFRNTPHLTANYSDTPNLKNVESMERMFEGATQFNGSVKQWDTKNVKTMKGMFAYAKQFNQNVNWMNTGNVTNMEGMFYKASSFDNNGEPMLLNTKSTRTMKNMFFDARSFNRNVSELNTSNVRNMDGVFLMAENFNRDISMWDTHNVQTMDSMFFAADSFNKDISTWCVSEISSKPYNFDKDSAFEDERDKQPNWGQNC